MKKFVFPAIEVFGFEPVDIITSSPTSSANNEDDYRPGIDGGLPSILWEDETGSNA